MINFKKYIIESNTIHNDNPKISAYDILNKYKDMDNIYISFSFVKEISIDSIDDDAIPYGVVCYPLKEIWKQNKTYQHKNIDFLSLYNKDMPYIQVIRLVNDDGCINDMYNDYTNVNFDNDIDKIKSLTGVDYKYINKIIINSQTNSKIKSPIGIFLHITNSIAKSNIEYFNIFGNGTIVERWANILKQLGYNGFADKSGRYIFNKYKRFQSLFLTEQNIKLIDIINR